MINRRSFIKLSSLAALGLSTGIITNNLDLIHADSLNVLMAYMPEDVDLALNIIRRFSKHNNISGNPVIRDDNKNRQNLFVRYLNNKSNYSNADYLITISDISIANRPGNILLYDNKKYIYNPESEFDSLLLNLKERLSTVKAKLLLTITYKKQNISNLILQSESKEFIIETDKGIVEKINKYKKYSAINIDGSLGKTVVKIEDGKLSVVSSSCKHKLCKRQPPINNAGEVIACVPNKIILRMA